MSEKIEIFDAMYNHIGIEERAAAHSEGLWHHTFHCWLIRKKNNRYYVLFQKRSAKKKDLPNMLDVTAAGHLKFDEKKEDGLREVKEELGIVVDSNSLHYLGIRIEVSEMPGYNNKEFQHVYLLEDDTPLDEYTLQENEVSGLVEVDVKEGLALLFGEKKSIECESVFIEDGCKKHEIYNMHYEDLIPRIDGYYKKILIIACQYFRGDTYLSI